MAAEAPRGRPVRHPPHLPQQPRKKEEFARVGARIATNAAEVSPKSHSQPPTQRRPGNDVNAAQASPRKSPPRSARGNPSDAPASARGPRRDAGARTARVSVTERARNVATPSGASDASGGGGADESPQATGAASDDGPNGSQALLKRLVEMSSASEGLRHQLEEQAKGVSEMQQQQLIHDYEQQVQRVRRQEGELARERARKEFGELEAELRREVDQTKQQAQRDREELLERIHEIDGERRQREGERDEARKVVRELENLRLDGGGGEGRRLEEPATRTRVEMGPELHMYSDAEANSRIVATGADAQARLKAVEMELALLRGRFAREADGRQVAERASAEGKAERMRLKAEVDGKNGEIRHLKKILAEQTELASFREELCNDLQNQLRTQKDEALHHIKIERGKFEAVRRLEGILPKNMLMKALACEPP